ncbi:hypothetical protein GIB67_005673 [Kingdonia uniflora]|uniref:Probable purine permease n=1 Tax=Kingdonia uniflora TaxID=39325 RepID=A0A7J7NI14_9MAGN|nr:hypothetical protein GIB67_005673 [Kingdonia uniflora]
MATTRGQTREARVLAKIGELQFWYFGSQSLIEEIPIHVTPTYYGMTDEEVDDDFFNMFRFHYIIKDAQQRRDGLRRITEQAILDENEAADGLRIDFDNMGMKEFGFHDVVIEIPVHSFVLSDLSGSGVEDVLLVYTGRILRYGMIQNQLTNIETLTDSNYSIWKLKIHIPLGYLDFDFVLTEAKPADLTDTSSDVEKVAYAKWVKANKMANLIIRSSIDPIIQGGITEKAGFPILFLSILLSYFYRRKNSPEGSKVKLYFLTWRLFVASAIIGVLTGVASYLYASGAGKLPVSTSTLLLSTQLAFIAGFAFIIVKQKFTSYSINSVVLLIVASLSLGLHANGDRPSHESNKTYYAGFFMTLGAAALIGLYLPMVEFMYMKAEQNITYYFVMEMQLVISIFATAFSTVGMLVNKDFQAIPKEARKYEIGEAKYYLVLVMTAVLWQCFNLGAAGVIFSASSLLSGIMISVCLPITEVLSVIFYHEDFKAEKGIALALSIWGFISYFYGEFKQSKQEKPDLNPENSGSTTL